MDKILVDENGIDKADDLFNGRMDLCIAVYDKEIVNILGPRDPRSNRFTILKSNDGLSSRYVSEGAYIESIGIVEGHQKRFYKLFNEAILRIVEAYNKKENKDQDDLLNIYALSNIMTTNSITALFEGEAKVADGYINYNPAMYDAINKVAEECPNVEIYFTIEDLQ